MEQMNNNNQPVVSSPVDISKLTAEERQALWQQLNAEAKTDRINRRDAYEGLRADFIHRIEEKTEQVIADNRAFKQWLEQEAEAFVKIMREYGQVKGDDQRNYTITDGDFRLQVSSNSVKGFDERADLAAERLIDYLKRYMSKSEKGQDDPMYQMAMTLLERNKVGDLDYKSISKLYELEDKFGDPEYAEIMQLFKESNVVQKNAVNFYFWRKDQKTGVWIRLEPSFCRL